MDHPRQLIQCRAHVWSHDNVGRNQVRVEPSFCFVRPGRHFLDTPLTVRPDDDPSSFHSHCLLKWLQTPFIRAHSIVSPSYVSKRTPTFSRSSGSTNFIKRRTLLVSSTVQSSTYNRMNRFSDSWRVSMFSFPCWELEPIHKLPLR